MKIKDIEQYRRIYKEQIRKNPDRNENFIGNFFLDKKQNKRIKGWFDLYFGDTDGSSTAQNGVENKLKSFLDMARDGQAIYEFLQNAVDAGGSKFLMFYKTDEATNEDYLLVINNGEMFSSASIRSILNIGSSTKSNDSEKIGQFGIGFKLAHRLVGKDNATSELIHNLNGPILFSWKHNEINSFESNVENTSIDYNINEFEEKIEINDATPWLFKILLTTFPCAFGEKPIVWDGKQAEVSPFSKEELDVLAHWLQEDSVRKHIENGFQEGALFLMKLGDGKLKEIKDEPNLKEGVRFSMAVLKETSPEDKGLRTAVINEVEVDHPELNFHQINISKNADDIEDYTYIRFGKTFNQLSDNEINQLNAESDIQILFGFKELNQINDYFKGSPSFYLYFPVSQEVHNFNYIIHSNALYKGSSRVFLQSGGGSGLNERLFKKTIERLEKELRLLFINDVKKFKNFYAALLTSAETVNNESFWITQSYTNPLNALLKTLVPVRDETNEIYLINPSNRLNSTYIIDTKISILGNNKYLIYDLDEFPKDYQYKITEKLGIRSYNLFDVLNIEQVHIRINDWLPENPNHYRLFYEELTLKVNFLNTSSLTSIQKDNLAKIRWIKLSNDELISIEEVEENGVFILNKNLFDIKDIFHKLGLVTSKYDLTAFINKFRNNFHQNEIKQFTYRYLTTLFTNQLTDEKLDTLNNSERYKIFEVFRTLDEKPGERLPLLKIYKNRIGQYQPLGGLTNQLGGLIDLFSINQHQIQNIDTSLLNNYLKVNGSELYERIYYPQWKEFLGYLVKNPDALSLNTVISELKYAYNHSTWKDKEKHLLSNYELVIFENTLIENKYLIQDQGLNKDEYVDFQKNINKYFKSYLPDSKYNEIFQIEAPFGYHTLFKNTHLDISNLSLEEIKDILEIAKIYLPDFLEDNVILYSGNMFEIKSSDSRQYYSANTKINLLVDEIFEDELILLPVSLIDYKYLVGLEGVKLYEMLINDERVYQKDNSHLLENLIAVAPQFDLETRKQLLNKILVIRLDITNSDNRESIWFPFLGSLKDINKGDLQNKILLVKDEVELYLSDIKPAIPNIICNGKAIDFDKVIPISVEESIAFEYYQKFIEKTEFDTEFFKRLFSLDANISTEDLKGLFMKFLNEDKEIINIYQLYFVVFSGLFKPEEFNEFKILNKADTLSSLTNQFNINTAIDEKYLHKESLLHSKYMDDTVLLEDLVSCLHIKLYPLQLDKQFKFEVLSAEVIEFVDKLELLYDLYIQTDISDRYIDESAFDNYLGVGSEQKLIGGYDEQLSLEVEDWVSKDLNKEEFLKALGFSLRGSAISTLLNAIFKNTDDVNHIEIDLLSTDQIEMLFKLCYDNDIKFSLSNKALFSFIIRLFRKNFEINPNLFLVYDSKEECRLVSDEIVRAFDYSIITGVLDQISLEDSKILFSTHNIMVLEVEDLFQDKKPLSLNYELIHENINELGDFYYKEWKKSIKDISIYREDELAYKIFVIIGDNEIFLGTVTLKDDVRYVEKNDLKFIYYTSNKSIKSMMEYFNSNQEKKGYKQELIEKLTQLNEFYNSFNATISELLENTDIEEIKDYFQSKIDKEERKTHRDGVIDRIKDSIKYSKDWFINYLDFLNSVTEKSNNNDIKSLSFNKIETTDKSNFYLLSACNSVIPENIDESKNVSIKIISGKQKETLSIKNISQKNQTVLVELNHELDNTLLNNFFIGEITYTPVIDLLERLVKAFNYLEEWEDINEKFPAIEYIYGPPGTGKTTTLKNRIIELQNNKNDVKVLVLAPTNKACDVLAEKLYDDDFYNFLRLSGPISLKLPEEHYTNELEIKTLNKLNVLISTIHRHSYFKVNTAHSQFYLFDYSEWDYIIIDEASMINLPYITFSSLITNQKSPNCKLIIAGDPNQIPPVPELKDEEREEIGVDTENIYTMFGLRSFDPSIQQKQVRQIDSVINLDVQYRSLPEIGHLFSNFSYENRVSSYRDSIIKRELPKEIRHLLTDTITFLNVPLERNNSLFSVNKLVYSSYHLYSALLVYEFINYFNQYCNDNENWTIGIISPYKAQAVLVSRLIGELKIKPNVKVYADTVHGFQGDECDIVFFICNPSSYLKRPHEKSLLANDFIYNVAVSRAKDYLIMVNPFENLSDNSFINKLKSINSEYKGDDIILKQHYEFEKNIFGQTSYIDNNTFITNHDDVNVYKSDSFRYYVKKNSLSIDFQIND